MKVAYLYSFSTLDGLIIKKLFYRKQNKKNTHYILIINIFKP